MHSTHTLPSSAEPTRPRTHNRNSRSAPCGTLADFHHLRNCTILGMLGFSRGTTRSAAENIVGLNPSASFAAQMGGALAGHGFTEFGIPVSVSQAVIGGIFGAAIPRNIVVRNDRLTGEIIIG